MIVVKFFIQNVELVLSGTISVTLPHVCTFRRIGIKEIPGSKNIRQ